jgi:riboflavin synthase
VFTGIVSDLGALISVKPGRDLRRMRIACRYPTKSIAVGASIMVDGACMTVVMRGRRVKGSWFEVDVGAESLARTTAARWQVGKKLNLERSLKMGDELGGHLVAGHVDGVARIVARDDVGDMVRFRLCAPKPLARFIAEKGSVTLDGVSLTVNEVSGEEFTVFLIPHTLKVTHWNDAKPGADINLEVDLLARYIARLAEAG